MHCGRVLGTPRASLPLRVLAPPGVARPQPGQPRKNAIPGTLPSGHLGAPLPRAPRRPVTLASTCYTCTCKDFCFFVRPRFILTRVGLQPPVKTAGMTAHRVALAAALLGAAGAQQAIQASSFLVVRSALPTTLVTNTSVALTIEEHNLGPADDPLGDSILQVRPPATRAAPPRGPCWPLRRRGLGLPRAARASRSGARAARAVGITPASPRRRRHASWRPRSPAPSAPPHAAARRARPPTRCHPSLCPAQAIDLPTSVSGTNLACTGFAATGDVSFSLTRSRAGTIVALPCYNVEPQVGLGTAAFPPATFVRTIARITQNGVVDTSAGCNGAWQRGPAARVGQHPRHRRGRKAAAQRPHS
jgi:hypothetical protein